MTVDDKPVLALATSVPVWREVKRGVRGDDVEALQAELARLGYDVQVDGRFGAGTRAAVLDVQKTIGVAKPSGSLAPADVLWLPAPSVSVSSCDLELGDAAPAPFATVAGTLDGLRVAAAANASTDAERVLALDDRTAPVSDDGAVTDREFLSAVAASDAFLGWRRTDGEMPLNLEFRLAEPLDVAVIPPGAVYGLAEDRGCVASDGVGYPVDVVASSLGQTSVVFDAETVPVAVDLTSQDGSGAC